jgi:hypothetical protein
VVRRIAKFLIGALPSALQRPVRGALVWTQQRLFRLRSRHDQGLDLPGSGAVVLLDARGLPSDQVLIAVDETLAKGPARVVLLIDDPRVHVYRSAPVAAVEYMPVNTASFSDVAAESRIATVRQTYKVDLVVRAGPPSATVV